MHQNPSSQAVLYAAKSTEDKRGSIPTQLDDGRAFAAREELEVVGEYADEAASAFTGNRGPELAAALDHAGRLGAALIVQHSDRLARGDGKQARHLAELYFEASRAGVRLRSVQDDSTFDSPILAAVMGERNTEDSRRKGLAVRAGHERRRKRGKHKGGPVLYGYMLRRNADDERVFVPDPKRAPVVRRIFAEFLAGQAQLAIARGLTTDGIPARGGARWYPGTVYRMLGNPAYAALIRDGDDLIPAVHEPIIDRKTWDQAGALLAAKSRTRSRGRPVAGLHLFRKGFLRCGECGASMVPRTDPLQAGGWREVYRCHGRLLDKATCSMPPIRRAKVDSAVYAYFEQVGLDAEATREQLAAAVDRKLAEARVLLNVAEQEEHAAAARMARVKRDYISGELTAAEWRELRVELEPEAAAAKAEAEQLRVQLIEAEAGTALTDVEDDVLESLAGIRAALASEVKDADGTAAARAVLMRLFDGFVLHVGAPDGQEHVELVGTQYWIEPLVSDRTMAGYDEKVHPVLARKSHVQAKKKCANVSL